MKKIWLVKFPSYIYTQNVKDIARQKGLKIVDAKYAENYNGREDVLTAQEAPKLTLKKEFQTKPADAE